MILKWIKIDKIQEVVCPKCKNKDEDLFTKMYTDDEKYFMIFCLCEDCDWKSRIYPVENVRIIRKNKKYYQKMLEDG